MLKWLDMPPVWLALMLALGFGFDRVIPGFALGLPGLDIAGLVLIVAGLVAMGGGLFELIRRKTTIIPRERASAFVTHGIYRLTRNPIYLGDVLVIAGAVLYWDILPAIFLVPLFVSIITKRFIEGEEIGLLETFGVEAMDYFAQVRRWI